MKALGKNKILGLSHYIFQIRSDEIWHTKMKTSLYVKIKRGIGLRLLLKMGDNHNFD